MLSQTGWPGFAAIAAGAVLGAWLRFALGAALNQVAPRLPLGTLAANLVGGLLIGAAVAWLARHPELSPAWRLFVVAGFLGALTTFSTFSIESLELLQRGDFAWAIGHTLVHVLGSLAAAAIGYRMLSG
ncbi:MAG: fluoride efflux transporter CrcB [Burkholderiaceae bacterium]|nr:fluoride efflux transporter CrcB [Burkholderiaceae bacterium]